MQRHLILSFRDSIQVYTTSDSLLVRTVPLPIRVRKENRGASGHIVAVLLSEKTPENVWVGCSDGRIWRIDWKSGATESFSTTTAGRRITDMSTQLMRLGKEPQEILFTSETAGSGTEIGAYKTTGPSQLERLTLHSSEMSIRILRSAGEGRFLVGASGETIVIGELKSPESRSFREMRYQFYSFDVNDEISSLDLQSPLPRATRKKSQHSNNDPTLRVLDLVVGCVRGAIFVYGDVLGRLRGPDGTGSRRGLLQARKHHWHRRAVRSVKWSQDSTSPNVMMLSIADRPKATTSYLADRKASWSCGKRRLASATSSRILALASRTSRCHLAGPLTPSTWMTTRRWWYQLLS